MCFLVVFVALVVFFVALAVAVDVVLIYGCGCGCALGLLRVELCVLRVVRRVLVTALYCVCGVLVHIHAWGRGKA